MVMIKRIISFILFIIIVFQINADTVSAAEHNDYYGSEIYKIIQETVEWKKSSLGINKDSDLLCNNFIKNAGDSSVDWYPFILGRIGLEDDYDGYLAVLGKAVEKRYQSDGKLSPNKATEWHRIGLAVLSCGGDPTNIEVQDDKTINLVEDGTYNRAKTVSMGEQGLNGWTWGLIMLDALRYKVPEDGVTKRDDIIKEILSYQNDDGGFALHKGDSTDVDITAMVLQALSPYYNSEQVYSYKNQCTSKNEKNTVREVVDEALVVLSSLQLEDGDFESWGSENLESTAQVAIALCSLNINLFTDKRFIKGENNLLDGMMKYHLKDGGFVHSLKYDENNPSSKPDEANSMASEQALCALTAICRYLSDMRSLYDLRTEMDGELKSQIKQVEKEIDGCTNDIASINQAFNDYKKIPTCERCYVGNYNILSDEMKKSGIINDSEYLSAAMEINTSGKGSIAAIDGTAVSMENTAIFTQEDVKESEDILSKNNTTEYYVNVVKLIHKLSNASNKDSYGDLYKKLQNKLNDIEDIKSEIDNLNNEILEKLYPFEELGISDKGNIDAIMQKYEKLSDYDKKQILHYDDVEKSYAQVNSKIRTVIIGGVLISIVIILIILMILRIKKRKLKIRKINEIEEDNEEEDWDE